MDVWCRPTLNYSGAHPADGPAPTVVEIRDGRACDLPGWEECGFELRAHTSAVRDWDDDDEIAAVHHPEMEALARELTGCDHAIVSAHIKRGPDQAARHDDLAPIRFVHSDFAAGYDTLIRGAVRAGPRGTPTVALDRNGVTAATYDDAVRIVVLQFWRNLGAPRMDLPIAFCDARTVRPGDGRPIAVRDYAGLGGPTFEALAIVAPVDPDRHRWYSFPDLRPDETVAFRTYDTELVSCGATYFTPHSAFRDPSVAPGEPARTSIELRAVCLFA